jgi:hypothetical protein
MDAVRRQRVRPSTQFTLLPCGDRRQAWSTRIPASRAALPQNLVTRALSGRSSLACARCADPEPDRRVRAVDPHEQRGATGSRDVVPAREDDPSNRPRAGTTESVRSTSGSLAVFPHVMAIRPRSRRGTPISAALRVRTCSGVFDQYRCDGRSASETRAAPKARRPGSPVSSATALPATLMLAGRRSSVPMGSRQLSVRDAVTAGVRPIPAVTRLSVNSPASTTPNGWSSKRAGTDIQTTIREPMSLPLVAPPPGRRDGTCIGDEFRVRVESQEP